MKLKYILPLLIIFYFSNIFAVTFSSDFLGYKGHRTTVNGVAYLNSDKKIVAIGGNNEIIIWDRNSKKILHRINFHQSKPLSFMSVNYSGSIAITVGFADRAIKVVDLNRGVLLKKIVASFSEYSLLKFLPKSNNFAVAAIDKNDKMNLSIWNSLTGKKIKTIYRSPFSVEKEYIASVDVSSNGKFCVMGTSNSKHGFKIINLQTNEIVVERKTDEDISTIKISPSNKFFVTGGTAKTVKVWNFKNGILIKKMQGIHQGYITSVDISPNGKYIVSVGFDNNSLFKVWDYKTGKLLQSMGNSSPRVNSVAFSHSGKSILIGLTTYGDLFDIATVREYFLFGNLSKQWKNFTWGDFNLSLKLPERPEEKLFYKSNRYYSYSKIVYKRNGFYSYIKIIDFKYKISDNKRLQHIKKSSEQLKNHVISQGGNVLSQKNIQINGYPGIEVIAVKKRRGKLKRYHFFVVFAKNFLYRIRVISKKGSESEKIFFNNLRIN